MIHCTDYAKHYPQWNNWEWQWSHRFMSSTAIASFLHLSEQEKQDIDTCLQCFRMAVTPYYASLIDINDPDDPIRKICIPSIQETCYSENDMTDPLGEVKDSPVPHVVHRYPDRVLLLVTLKCSTYCRYCTRKRIVGHEDREITEPALQRALVYIRKHPEIRDVLISGGDPFCMSTPHLEHIIASLRAIPHVDIIRLGTRVPVVLPMRIDDELINMLKRYHPIWVNTHFAHPREITAYSQRACEALVDAGIPLGNQTVLLRGINDTLETMKQLMLKLVHIRVRPYYLYQCDLSKGIGHFRTNIDKGIEIIHGLTGFISGFAVPKFVIDAPGGGGKIPLNYNYVISKNDQEVVLENFQGKHYTYPQPLRP